LAGVVIGSGGAWGCAGAVRLAAVLAGSEPGLGEFAGAASVATTVVGGVKQRLRWLGRSTGLASTVDHRARPRPELYGRWFGRATEPAARKRGRPACARDSHAAVAPVGSPPGVGAARFFIARRRGAATIQPALAEHIVRWLGRGRVVAAGRLRARLSPG
jgi:hypothetical protein